MLHDQFDIVGDLVECLGRDDFDKYFFRLYDEVLSITYCTVFEYFGDKQARTIMAIGRYSNSDNSTRTLAYDYINGFFREDPHYKTLINVEKSEHPEWKKSDPTKIEDEIYRAKFYEKPELSYELLLPYKDARHSIIASLYRNYELGPFNSSDEKRASVYIELSLKLLNKHIELLNLNADEAEFPKVKPYFRIYDLLIAQSNLSPREAEICSMILVGYSTLAISLNLEISENTVATHRKRAYRKLGIGTQNELFCRCFEVM